MSIHDDLRGSAPALSARDVLLELRTDVKAMKSSVDILASQDLHQRLVKIEAWQNRVLGLAAAGSLLGVLATALAIVNSIHIGNI